MKTQHHIIQWPGLLARNQATPRHLSLLALLLGLFWPGFAGATEFYSIHDGSWFDAPNTWGQASSPGNGDDVNITKNVTFDSSTSGQSVTVGNLSLANGRLWMSGPASLAMAGTNSLVTGNSFFTGVIQNLGSVWHTTNSVLTIWSGSHFQNLAGGVYDFEGDGSITYTTCCSGPPNFDNYGLLRKSGGTGISSIGDTGYYLYLNNQNGTIEVDSGTLKLAGGGTSANGTFVVASGAVLDLTGGSSPTWAGQVFGSGGGLVSLNSGTLYTSPSLTLNLPDGLFQWTGGTLYGTTINSDVVTIGGAGFPTITGMFSNNGLMRHTNNATLVVWSGSRFQNLSGGTYDLEGDGCISNTSCCSGPANFDNYGLLRKSSGTGISISSDSFNNQGGTIEVDRGALSLAGGGTSTNGTVVVASGAVLDLTGGNGPTWAGQVNGSGTGQVSLNSGTVYSSPSLTLNLPDGLFQWTGGRLYGTTINSNVVTISGSGSPEACGVFANNGLVRHTNNATLIVDTGSHFQNLADGTYDLEGDGSISEITCCSGPGNFDNYGLLRKSGGTGTSTNSENFNNQGGTIEVDSGTLKLAGGGSSSNGTFNVTSGAVLDLTSGSSPTWAGLVNGSGSGQVSLNSGTLYTSPSLTLNLPDGLFQWAGGTLYGTTVNSNVVTIGGSGFPQVAGVFANDGLVRHTNSATLVVWSGSRFQNLAGGIYDLEGDGNISETTCCSGPGNFDNYGLLRKSAGTGTSTISASLNNQNGAIEVDCGQLSLNGQAYAQGTGSFTVTLGGTNSGQSGKLACGTATLGGPLQVKLAGGYVPAISNQFQIISCSSRAGAFSSTNVPAGISVTYSNNGVYLVVTRPVLAQILNPVVSGGNLTFSLGTVNNQSYIVQHNDDLATINWVFDTNFTGNGSLMQVVTPVTNVPMRFFRVWEP